ncbi:polysaccharide pyruvyl transferase family protein [Mycetocola manganoxydans]|nr:polysaccharide pyruvyl transferase family protein [Mycetocola manganoxydans]
MTRRAIIGAARRARTEADRVLSQTTNKRKPRRIAQGNEPARTAETRTQVILPAAYGSMGDDALRAGTEEGANELNERVDLWMPGTAENWPAGHESVQSLEPLRIGQTGVLNRRALERFGRSDTTVIGADTLGGNYLHGFLGYRVAALRQAAFNGRRAKLANFSMGASPTPTALKLLRSLPSDVELWARDELSRERTQTFLQRDVRVAPDVGALALATPTRTAKDIAERHATRGYVTLVPNAHFETLGWFTRTALVDFWVEVGVALSADYGVVLLPHDVRGRPGDVALSEEISKALERRVGEKVDVFTPQTAAQAKYVLQGSKGVVSARMHACVGALASGVPCVGLEYLGKFAGQFAWYGELGSVVPLESAVDAQTVLSAFRSLPSRSTGTWTSPVTAQSIGWLKS